MSEFFDPGPVLGGLKDFQRKTVDYVFERLYGPSGTRRFLVADEVGLGKTLVARGVVAKAIEHLHEEGVDRIDVVYVCSNADIARQNINRLNVTGKQEFNLPTRLTLLPLHLRQIKNHGLNFVSFTPGTTFDLKSRAGVAMERALLYRLLQYGWGRRGLGHRGVFRLLRGQSRLENFRGLVDHHTPDRFGDDEGMIDKDLADAFIRELERHDAKAAQEGEPTVQERFMELAERLRRGSGDHWNERAELVGELRRLLARSCVTALEADVIILDEFQRFRDLLDGDSDAAELAGHLFDEQGARVLLLSATPYKMYTLSDEKDEDHYADFVRTARFLMGPEDAARFEEELRDFRRALLDLDHAEIDEVIRRKQRAEDRLRTVMVRTERLGVTDDRDGMLVDRPSPGARLEEGDLRAFITAQKVSRHLGAGDALEYWKSGSYLLNFMESYKLKRELKAAVDDDDLRAELRHFLEEADGLLDLEQVEAYGEIDPGNARLRALIEDTVDNGAWRLLWLPPSLPYYQLRAPFDDPGLQRFTKRLVFSSWSVVPQVISTLVSYEVERRMMRSRSSKFKNSKGAYQDHTPLLRFGRTGDRLTSLSLLALMYPSPVLADVGDPLEISSNLGGGEEPPTLDAVLAVVKDRLRAAMAPLTKSRPMSGPEDESWYWAAPLLLDDAAEGDWAAEWLGRRHAHEAWTGREGVERKDGTLWAEHIQAARDVLDDPSTLGRVPDDLIDVLAMMAVGGPATCALRAFARVSHETRDFRNANARDGAARVAWGIRSFFNVPEVMALVRGYKTGKIPYWQKVIRYCMNGGLQAVLSEYAHVLRESLGFLDRNPDLIVPEMARVINDALSIRAASYTTDDIRVEDGDLTLEPRRLRARYALRFGTQSLDGEAELQRAGVVRTAFNSPFWPFVLATTSVGQEGLDFHQYCHAVVHWNLPANPVDLEQREGRVHRYKGHAIRKNLASAHREDAFDTSAIDPWEAMFDAAVSHRADEIGDLVPYWMYSTEGGARIERYVPALPLSREIEKLELLKRSLAAYRLVFGQPRQEDLIAFLDRVAKDRPDIDLDSLTLDLSPR